MDYKKYNSTHIMVALYNAEGIKNGTQTMNLILDVAHMYGSIESTLRALARPYRVCAINVYNCDVEMSEMYARPIWQLASVYEKKAGRELELK